MYFYRNICIFFQKQKRYIYGEFIFLIYDDIRECDFQ